MISRRSIAIAQKHVSRSGISRWRARPLVQFQTMFKSSDFNKSSSTSSSSTIDSEYGRTDSRPHRIEVDPEKEARFDRGPKSQAECPIGGMNRHGARANEHVTAEGRGEDSQNPYREPENLDLGDTYGRDYEVEKENAEGSNETRFVRPDYRKEKMELEEGKREFKTQGTSGYSKKVGTGRRTVGRSTDEEEENPL